MKQLRRVLLLSLGLVVDAFAQSPTLAEVTARGASPLTAAEAKELVSGAKTELLMVQGSRRAWTNEPDGTFIASRSNGDSHRRSARGKWSIDDDAAYCVSFDWGAGEVESWCRQLYRVDDRYLAFGRNATTETRSGDYRFSR